MEENQVKDSLYIPQGIKRKREYFSGYGKSEFQITIIFTLIAAIICMLLYMTTKNVLIAVFAIMAIPTTTVLVLVKNESNISVVDQVRFMIRFHKEQKKYKYVFQDEMLWKK